MRENLLFIMTLSGTIAFLLYLFIRPISRRYFSLRWSDIAVKGCLTLFLFPFPLFKYLILRLFYRLFPTAGIFLPSETQVHLDIMFDKCSRIVQLSLQVRYVWFALLVCGMLSAILLISQGMRYYRARKLAFSDAEEIVSGPLSHSFTRLKEALKIRRRVRLYRSPVCHGPMAVGVFSPVVILPPESPCDYDAAFSDVLKHELIHIKHRDLFLNLIGLAVIAVHWFNPVCYALYFELCNLSELRCDYEVVNGKSAEEQNAYFTYLINAACPSAREGLIPVSRLAGNDAKVIKRRISAMKNPVSKPKKLLSCLVGASIVLASGLTVLAYEAPTILNNGNRELSQTAVFSPGFSQQEVPQLPFDRFFTDADGAVFPAEGASASEKALCRHEYVDGTYTDHKTYADGSCKVTNYNAKRCKLCGNIVLGSVISTVTYEPCPH